MTFSYIIILYIQSAKPCKNIVGKGEDAGNQHFLFFSQWFLATEKQIQSLDSVSNDKFLDWSKLKAFADDKINVT